MVLVLVCVKPSRVQNNYVTGLTFDPYWFDKKRNLLRKFHRKTALITKTQNTRKQLPQSHNRVFSGDVTVAMLVSLNKGTAAILVPPIIPSGVELYSYANVLFCFRCSLVT